MTATERVIVTPNPETVAAARAAWDLQLLGRHAPILCLDVRELFRPCAIEGYVAGSTMTDGTIVEPDVD